MVGCFLGLSRDRANARRFPSIHPLDSWSKYPSIVEVEKLNRAKALLSRSSDVHQMMMVVGEEGTSIGDYIIYLKGEFLDSVYLQQNTFDDVDAACSMKRQEFVFDKVMDVLEASFHFEEKDDARTYFNRLRQLFIDWNYMPHESDSFTSQTEAIDKAIAEALHA